MSDEKLYQYTGCDLDYIYLTNGYEIKETPFGKGVTIQNLDGLHRAIANDLVNNKPTWSGQELRFIRKELGLTQQSLGAFVSRDSQSVALWEKESVKPMPEEATTIIRAIYQSRMDGSVNVEKMIERMNQLDRELNDIEKRRKSFEAGAEGWHTIKAA